MIHQATNSHKGGELCIFIHESLCCKPRKDLSINSEAIESLSIEISNKKFFDLVYEGNLIPTVNKPTRVGKNSTTAIDHIITDYYEPATSKQLF